MKNTHFSTIRILILVLIVFTVIFSCIGCGNASSDTDITQENVTNSETASYQLIRVVDGDTLEVLFNGEKAKVRLIGINTPESVASDNSRNTKEGKIASEYVKDLLSNSSVVWLEFDEGMYDQYGRLLAYVYLDDGTMLNEHMLEIGYARTSFYAPNFKYQTRLETAQKSAQKQQAGFWATKSGRDALHK